MHIRGCKTFPAANDTDPGNWHDGCNGQSKGAVRWITDILDIILASEFKGRINLETFLRGRYLVLAQRQILDVPAINL